MDHTVEIYEAEKELREKRLAAYAEAIQKKVQRNSEQIIKELVEERYRQNKTQQEMADALFISANTLKSKQGGAMCLPIRFGHISDIWKMH